jgi:hypothetical protein
MTKKTYETASREFSNLNNANYNLEKLDKAEKKINEYSSVHTWTICNIDIDKFALLKSLSYQREVLKNQRTEIIKRIENL